jgi:hydrogenase maturation protease
MRVLIAGVGHPDLRDLSLGPLIVPLLRRMAWPDGVEIDDLSFGAIAVMQRFQDCPTYYDRCVLISAMGRGRAQGHIYTYRWDGKLPAAEDIQRRVGEAATGIVSIDNLLIISQYFGVLPREVFVVEIEPIEVSAGATFTPEVQAMVGDIIQVVQHIALEGMRHGEQQAS